MHGSFFVLVPLLSTYPTASPLRRGILHGGKGVLVTQSDNHSAIFATHLSVAYSGTYTVVALVVFDAHAYKFLN